MTTLLAQTHSAPTRISSLELFCFCENSVDELKETIEALNNAQVTENVQNHHSDNLDYFRLILLSWRLPLAPSFLVFSVEHPSQK